MDGDYDHHVYVEARTPGEDATETIELLTCSRCGSVVRAVTMDTHDRWHRELDRHDHPVPIIA